MARSFYLICLLSALLPFGQAAAEGIKIGVINVPKVLDWAAEASDVRKRLETEFAPRDRELVDLQKEIRKLEDRLVRDSVTMAEAELRKLERNVRSRKRELKRLEDEFREDLNLRRNTELRKLQNKVRKAINELAKAEKYDLVLEQAVYVSKQINITKSVIERLKKQFDDKGAKKK